MPSIFFLIQDNVCVLVFAPVDNAICLVQCSKQELGNSQF